MYTQTVVNENVKGVNTRGCVVSFVTNQRYIAAGAPNTTFENLAKYAFDSCAKVRLRVAENVKTPMALLEQLAFDSNDEVRLAVFENPSTPIAIREILAQDENEDVRYGIAENPKTPAYILVSLADDVNPYIADRADKTLKGLLQQLRPAA
jgi:hypothetical protein